MVLKIRLLLKQICYPDAFTLPAVARRALLKENKGVQSKGLNILLQKMLLREQKRSSWAQDMSTA